MDHILQFGLLGFVCLFVFSSKSPIKALKINRFPSKSIRSLESFRMAGDSGGKTILKCKSVSKSHKKIEKQYQ